MANITISLDDDLLKAGRKYAQKHQTSMNALIRKLLSQAVTDDSNEWIEECFRLMDRTGANSKGLKWKREDLYDV
jgi:plasmid stability protein